MSKPKGHRAAEGKTFFAKSSICDGEQKDKCSSLSFYWQRYGFSHFMYHAGDEKRNCQLA